VRAFIFEVWKGANVAGLTHFVAAALPKFPICALKLGDRTFNSDALRGLPQGFRRARSLSVAPPPVRFAVRALFSSVWKGAIVAGLTHFVAAALPKSPVCALELGDRTSRIGALRWIPHGLRRARDSSAEAPPPRTARVARSQTRPKCVAERMPRGSWVFHFPWIPYSSWS
jgi:hypothetical protein